MRIRGILLTGALLLSGLGFSAQSASANTIQPIFMSVSGPSGGNYTYVYDLQLTPNNGLSNNVSFPSSVTIVDIGTISGTPTLSFAGGLVGADVTSAADWAVFTSTVGAPSLVNASYVPITFTLSGSGNTATATDLASAMNVTVKYQGAGLGTSGSQRSLAQLTIVTNLAPGPVLQSLSMNTALGNINQADTFPVLTAVVPVPAAAWAGFSMLAGLGVFSALRKRRTV